MRADILSAALASSGDAAATIPAVRNFRRSIGLAAVTAFVAVSIPWADTSPCREPTGIMRCIIGIDNCLRFDVYVMAPLSHAFTQLKHTTHRLVSTTWSGMLMHSALHTRTHFRHWTHLSVSMSIWNIEYRLTMPRAAPVGQAVLQNHRPWRIDVTAIMANVATDMMMPVTDMTPTLTSAIVHRPVNSPKSAIRFSAEP